MTHNTQNPNTDREHLAADYNFMMISSRAPFPLKTSTLYITSFLADPRLCLFLSYIMVVTIKIRGMDVAGCVSDDLECLQFVKLAPLQKSHSPDISSN